MTIDHPLRRALARVCSTTTMTRIVDPILADIRWEDGHATLRGCVSLARALVLHAVLIGYWTLMIFEERLAKSLIGAGGFFPEYLCAWTANAILLLVATAILLSRRSLRRPPAQASLGA
jgi:hypothetical protein